MKHWPGPVELLHYSEAEVNVRRAYRGEEGAQLELLGGLMDVQATAVVAPREAYHRKRGKMDDYLPGGKKWTGALGDGAPLEVE